VTEPTTTRRCTKCGEEKPLAEFNLRGDADARAAGKRRSACRRCASRQGTAYAKTPRGAAAQKKAVRTYLSSAKGHAQVVAYRESDRGREVLRAGYRRYHATPHGKANHIRGFYRDRERHPEKHRARQALQAAVKAGRIVKGPCARCGSSERVHGHHPDYARPLEVTWLCPPCHRKEHAA
jgi:hypothetical protein